MTATPIASKVLYKSFDKLSTDGARYGVEISLESNGKLKVDEITIDWDRSAYIYYVDQTDDFNQHTDWGARYNDLGNYCDILVDCCREHVVPAKRIKKDRA
jgi:hypothetical protein